MSSSPKQSLKINVSQRGKTLSADQKRFNETTQKIEEARKRLESWQAFIPELEQRRNKEFMPLHKAYEDSQAAFACHLDGFYPRKSFSQTQREKLEHLILETCRGIAMEDRRDVKAIYDKYSDISYDDELEEQKLYAGDLMRDVMAAEYGVDLGDDFEFDLDNPEKMAEKLAKIMEGKPSEAEEEQEPAKKTAKQERAEAAAEMEEKNISKSLKSVYRQLTTSLHPDREQDPEERQRKTDLMQQVNKAYKNKDLLAMLELQLSIEHIDQDNLNNIAADKLKYFNKVLDRQLQQIKAEIEDISLGFAMTIDVPPHKCTPKSVGKRFEQDLVSLQQDIDENYASINALRTVKSIQAYLRHYQIPFSPFSYF